MKDTIIGLAAWTLILAVCFGMWFVVIRALFL